MTIKLSKLMVAVGLLQLVAGTVHGAVVYDQTFTSGFASGGYVPDNDSLGWQDSRTVSGVAAGQSITTVQVSLDIAGGWNGDLYGYLSYQPVGGGTETLLVLLNQVGAPGITRGYGDSGFLVTLSDAGAHPIENYQDYSSGTTPTGQVQGTWQANDGSATFGGAGGTFTGLDPNGTWSLFLADQSALDQSAVTSWSLQIQSVPEPTTWAMLGFGAVFAGTGAARWWRTRNASNRREEA